MSLMISNKRDRIIFTVCLAGVPIQIRCRHEENRAFLEDYLTDQEPVFAVEPATDDLEQVRQGFTRMYGDDDLPAPGWSDRFLENNAIHALIARELVNHHVLLLHGSALCMDQSAVIFTAPSGTGKSTQARLWRETFGNRVWMINDDKPLVRIEGGRAVAYGSPWDGKHHLSCNASAPIKAILRVFRSEANHLEPMGKADAFQMLLLAGYASKEPEIARRILALNSALTGAVAFYGMHCNMNPEAALCAWKGISEN